MVIQRIFCFYAIPVRSLPEYFFRGQRMLLLISAGLNVWFFHSTVYRNVAEWDFTSCPTKKGQGGASPVLQYGLVFDAAHILRYNWFDCDKPQRAIITGRGCRTDSRSQFQRRINTPSSISRRSAVARRTN